MNISKLNIVLGSQSPRRKELLEKMGLSFEVIVTNVDESYDPLMDPKDVAEFLSNKKATALVPRLGPDQVGITADSIVVLDEKIYEKPLDENDAFRILSQLSGKTHTVYTGVTIINKSKRVSFTDETLVHMLPMNDSEIRYYIENYKPYDKAGSYGIQDWVGVCKVGKIEGSYPTVMGLPVHRVYNRLQEFL